MASLPFPAGTFDVAAVDVVAVAVAVDDAVVLPFVAPCVTDGHGQVEKFAHAFAIRIDGYRVHVTADEAPFRRQQHR